MDFYSSVQLDFTINRYFLTIIRGRQPLSGRTLVIILAFYICDVKRGK